MDNDDIRYNYEVIDDCTDGGGYGTRPLRCPWDEVEPLPDFLDRDACHSDRETGDLQPFFAMRRAQSRFDWMVVR